MISVVMPSYNQASYIGDAIDSVFLQNALPEVELIISDGGSDDGTVDILKTKASQYSSLFWTSEPDNGPAEALNKALLKTRGTVIGWLNSDDLYVNGALLAAQEFFEDNPRSLMVYGHGDHVDQFGKVLKPYPTHKPDVGFEALFNGSFICQPTVFFRRSLYSMLGPLDQSFKAGFDFEYWMRVFKHFGDRIGFINHVVAQSRLHDDCITQKNRELVTMDGIRAVHLHFGSAPMHWLSSYIEEIRLELGPDRFATEKHRVVEFVETLHPYFNTSEFSNLVASLRNL